MDDATAVSALSLCEHDRFEYPRLRLRLLERGLILVFVLALFWPRALLCECECVDEDTPCTLACDSFPSLPWPRFRP